MSIWDDIVDCWIEARPAVIALGVALAILFGLIVYAFELVEAMP